MLFWLMIVIVNVVAVEPFFGEIFTSILNALQIQLGNYVITTSPPKPVQTLITKGCCDDYSSGQGYHYD
jgi:hypothetical protein